MCIRVDLDRATHIEIMKKEGESDFKHILSIQNKISKTVKNLQQPPEN